MAKRKKKEIVPGNASKKRMKEFHKKPENKYGISKGGWWALVACETVLLVVCFVTGNIIYGIPALILAFFIEHNGMDVLLEDYNNMMEDRRQAIGVAKEGMSDEERKEFMEEMRKARIAKRREKKERKEAEAMGLTYEQYLEAKRLGEERVDRDAASREPSDACDASDSDGSDAEKDDE